MCYYYIYFIQKYKCSFPHFFFFSFQCYKRILQLDPINIQGLHNLCVVYVERGKLAKAQECLQHAHQLAPTEDYILRHLQIVQTRISKLKQTAGMHKEKEIAFAEFDPKDFGGNILSAAPVDENVDNVENTIPPPIVSDVPDGKKETQKSVSKQEKPQTPPKLINHQPAATSAASVVDESSVPTFIEAETIASSKIQEEYRTSNSGQNGINRRNRYHHLQSHVPHSRASQSMLGNDNDDPSSGMS